MKEYISYESKFIELIFAENINKNEKYFVNSIYYIHQIMVNIKDKNKNAMAVFFINKH